MSCCPLSPVSPEAGRRFGGSEGSSAKRGGARARPSEVREEGHERRGRRRRSRRLRNGY